MSAGPHQIAREIREVVRRKAEFGDAGSGRPDPVLITGMHNSGTSLLAGIIHECGVFLGAGMHHHESRLFSILVNDSMIMGGGRNWARLPIMDVETVMSFKDTAGRFALEHWLADYSHWGYDGVSRWGFKDPRLCVLLPLYLELFPEAVIVHIRRDPDDVAASLCERIKSGVGRLDDFEHWRELTMACTDRVLECAGGRKAYYELKYEKLCTDSERVLSGLLDFLGLEVTDKARELIAGITQSRIGSYKRRAVSLNPAGL